MRMIQRFTYTAVDLAAESQLEISKNECLKRFWLIRHGECEANVFIRHRKKNPGAKRPPNDLFNSKLTLRGHEQAKEAGQHLAFLFNLADRPVDRVFSSPLQRAVQTADRIAPSHLSIEIEEKFRERLSNSSMNRRGPKEEIKDWCSRAIIPDNMSAEDTLGESFIGQEHESWKDLVIRQREGLDLLMEKSWNCESIAVVSHQGSLSAQLEVLGYSKIYPPTTHWKNADIIPILVKVLDNNRR